jgi:hypothetical protein
VDVLLVGRQGAGGLLQCGAVLHESVPQFVQHCIALCKLAMNILYQFMEFTICCSYHLLQVGKLGTSFKHVLLGEDHSYVLYIDGGWEGFYSGKDVQCCRVR